MNALNVAGLRKSYGSHEAVRDVTFHVGEGEIFALLGPNSAGKTTTLEILKGFRDRDGGEVEVLGRDPGSTLNATTVTETPQTQQAAGRRPVANAASDPLRAADVLAQSADGHLRFVFPVVIIVIFGAVFGGRDPEFLFGLSAPVPRNWRSCSRCVGTRES